MTDTEFMAQAIALAKKGLGRTAPNPPVGAIIVKDGRVIGEGYHQKAGTPHAEIVALTSCTEDPKGATIYVTLEPCCHHGKTPPCTQAIQQAGIKRVVFGANDPNPVVSCKGMSELQGGGLEVVAGVCRQEAEDLILWYTHWMKTKRPFTIAKAAMTLDGRIATLDGDSKWISSEESRKRVHELRDQVDGILVGIGTVMKDDPLLTCRVQNGRDPLRIILDKHLNISNAAKCLGQRCMIITESDPKKRPEILESGSQVIQLVHDKPTESDWEKILDFLGEQGLHSVLIEGGSGIFSSFLKTDLLDALHLYIAPRLLGGGMPLIDWPAPKKIVEGKQMRFSRSEMIGGDIFIEANRES